MVLPDDHRTVDCISSHLSTFPRAATNYSSPYSGGAVGVNFGATQESSDGTGDFSSTTTVASIAAGPEME